MSTSATDAILGPAQPLAPTDSTPDDAEALDADSRAVTGVAERLSPSVGNLRVSRRVRGGRILDGGGSSVVITPDGFMLTSAHVVGRTDGTGRATFVDGRELDFELIGADPLSDLAVLRAVARDLEQPSGVEVVEVIEGSPAARAGLRGEDLIVAIDGVPIVRVDELHRLMVGDAIGRTLRVTLIREGRRLDVELVPAELEG